MKHKTKVAIVSLTSLVTGLGLTFGIDKATTSNAANVAAIEQTEMAKVYFTVGEIKGGTVITQNMIIEGEFPKAHLPKNVMTELPQIVGMYVKEGYSLSENSFLFRDFLSVTSDPKLNIDLTEGEYTFPLLVSAENSLVDAIKPNDLIDIAFRSVTLDREGNERSLYGKIANNLRVAIVETESVNTDGKPTSSLSRMYTLVVDKETERILHNAIKLGELIPVLRNDKDENTPVDVELIKLINDYSSVVQNLRHDILIGEEDIIKGFSNIYFTDEEIQTSK